MRPGSLQIPLAVSVLFAFLGFIAPAAEPAWKPLAPPQVDGPWIQPTQGQPARPVWGHAQGLRVGLPPMPGPRGLLRIYAPYLGHREDRVVNFIAIEPIPEGQTERGFSELERSDLDRVNGKRFWSADLPRDASPAPVNRPARGIVRKQGETETLTVFVLVERFHNGAHVYLRLRFRSDRPCEVGLATFAWEDSTPLQHCILTATMGNYARLRTLYLKDGPISSLDLWPDYTETGFAPHARFALKEMIRTREGHALFIAAPNEAAPSEAEYAPGTPYWWKYEGKVATQYWRCEKPDPQLAGLVNGRYTYWLSECPIPGGIALENFELMEPFRSGAEYIFGVTAQSAGDLIKSEE